MGTRGRYGAPLGACYAGVPWGASDSRAEAIAGAYAGRKGMSLEVAAAMVAVADRLGADAYDLANLINFESGWNPQARNPTSGATGLIQFMKKTAQGMGTSTDAIYQLSAMQQLPLVEQYLSPYRGRLNSVQALYMAVFYPKAMTWSLDTPMPEIVRKANPGINSVGDYVRYANRRAKLPSSDSRGGRIVEAVAAVSPVVSYSVAAQSGALATRARDRYRSHRTPLLLLGTLGFGAVALLAIRARRGAAQSSPSPLPA